MNKAVRIRFWLEAVLAVLSHGIGEVVFRVPVVP